MTVRTVNILPAATHGETVRCLFAIELSKQSRPPCWQLTPNFELNSKIQTSVGNFKRNAAGAGG